MPSAMLRTLDLAPGDKVDVTIQDGRLVLEPLRGVCGGCGGHYETGRRPIPEVNLCAACVARVRRLDLRRREAMG